MTVFDGRRLSASVLRLDVEGLRRGYYSDKYFENIAQLMQRAHSEGYTFQGNSPRALPISPTGLQIADLEVEAQVFNRRTPYTLIGGVDAALAMLRSVSGRYEGAEFVSAVSQLQVEAVEDGILAHYNGNTEQVAPVIRVRGPYLDFAILETPILGVLTRATRIATNVYQALKAARGKPVLFFPARFDLPEVQPVDGYAYWLAIQRYNADTGHQVVPFISTDAQGQWWGGTGGGTVPHALIACFLADTAEAMRVFAEYVPADVSRVALVDFNNDTVGASLATLRVYWPQYLKALEAGDSEGQKRWTLAGVRLDTARNMRDVSLAEGEGYGVNPRLVRNVREALDHAWESWNVSAQWVEVAKRYCRQVKIVVTGGFTVERIEQFEIEQVPVDTYGVGSTFLRNAEDTNTDFTMDVVRIKLRGQWVDIAKLGRKANENPLLKPIDLLSLPE